MAIVLGLKARRLARDPATPIPARAVVGLVCGVVSLLMAVAGWFWFATDQLQKSRDIENLQAQTGPIASQKKLTQAGACKMVQLEILEGRKWTVYSLRKIRCKGTLEREGNQAVLSEVKILKSKTITVKGCLMWTGSTWVVKEVRRSGECWPGAEEN